MSWKKSGLERYCGREMGLTIREVANLCGLAVNLFQYL